MFWLGGGVQVVSPSSAQCVGELSVGTIYLSQLTGGAFIAWLFQKIEQRSYFSQASQAAHSGKIITTRLKFPFVDRFKVQLKYMI